MNTTNTLIKKDDGSIEITIIIPWESVKSAYQEALNNAIGQVELPGFRKGKAPANIVEEHISKTKLYEDAIKQIIPQAYQEAVTHEKLHPVIMPRVELTDAKEEADWKVTAVTCEKPTVILREYKKAIVELVSSKRNKIWVPGQEPKNEADQKKEESERKPTLDELLKTLYKAVSVNLPAILIEQEVNKLLSHLVDQTKRVGLSVEQYLTSTGKNMEAVKKEYEEEAKRTLTLEFSLEAIADSEGVLVSDDDIENVIKSAKTEEEKQSLTKQRYYLAEILRRQKTIAFLASIT